MQVSHRPQGPILAACLLAVLCGGCEAVGPERPTAAAAALERADREARQGNHIAAARALEAAARSAGPGERNRLWFAAVAEWLLARDTAAAAAALARTDRTLAAGERREHTRLSAELALARDASAQALALLAELPEDVDAATQATRARILFRAGRVPEAIRALIARGRLIEGAAAELENGRLILEGIGAAQRLGADLRAPAEADALLAGWIELGRIVADAGAGALGTQRRLQTWRARYPAHPATAELWQGLLVRTAPSGDEPRRIGLLLPLSGRAAAAGAAVRDGFLGAYYGEDTPDRPLLRIYDVADGDVAGTFRRAVADGSDFIVGPLTREEVTALARATDGRTNVLALNFLPEGVTAPGRFFQYALSPEDEARQAARRIVADGHHAGIALVPDSDWGWRTLGAFTAELMALGGRLVARGEYPAATTDFKELLHRLLLTSGERGSAPRADAEFVFLVAQPVHGRMIRSQLRFNHAGALPVYATSDVFEPGATGNLDLEGVRFPGMPWHLDPLGPAGAARETAVRAFGGRGGGPGRLYAFGYDAYRIAMDLRRLQGRGDPTLPGLTGRLGLGSDGRVYRDLQWARISDGQVVPLP